MLPTGRCDDVIEQKQKSLLSLQTFTLDLKGIFTLNVYFTSDDCSECFDSFGDIFLTSVNPRVHGGVHISAGYVRAERLPPGCSTAGWVPVWVSRPKDGPINTEEGLKRLPSGPRQGHPGWAVFARGLSPHPPQRPLMKHQCNCLLIWDKVCRAKELQLTCLRHGKVSVANVC